MIDGNYTCDYHTYVELGSQNYGKDTSSPIYKLKNNPSISIQSDEDGGAGWLYDNHNVDGNIYYNNVYYGYIEYTEYYNFMITVPNNIEDTEEAYINYALPKIEKRIKEYAGGGNANITGTLKVKKQNGNTYIVSDDKQNFGNIIIKKDENAKEDIVNKVENVNITTDGIKIDSTTNVVPKNTTLSVEKITSGNSYNTVSKVLGTSVNKFVVYDISLLSNNTKIQPNGKVKVSIPIPSDYNRNKLEVYRIKDNGEKIKYDVTVEGDYATFETDHFSTYVLAETHQNSKEKDETPKTGTTNIIGYVLAITIVSGAGIVILKKNLK